MKVDLDAHLDSLSEMAEVDSHGQDSKTESKIVPDPSEGEMESFFEELNSCKFKPIAQALFQADSFVLKSR